MTTARTTPKYIRAASACFALLLLAAVLLSTFYVAAEAGHDCAGENCAVCACIGLFVKTLRQLTAVASVQLAVFLPAVFLLFCAFAEGETPAAQTPVSEKVRLDN